MEPQRHREACDACHKRKVRCPVQGPGACMNCQHSGRICVFSPRDEMGRPKKNKTASDHRKKSTTRSSMMSERFTTTSLGQPPTIPTTNAEPSTSNGREANPIQQSSSYDLEWQQPESMIEASAGLEYTIDASMFRFDSVLDTAAVTGLIDESLFTRSDIFTDDIPEWPETLAPALLSNASSDDVTRSIGCKASEDECRSARPATALRSHTWCSSGQTLNQSQEHSSKPMTEHSSDIYQKLSSILFSLQLELGRTRPGSYCSTAQVDAVFTEATTLCDVVDEMLSYLKVRKDSMVHELDVQVEPGYTTEHVAPQRPDTNGMLEESNMISRADTWTLVYTAIAMIFNVYTSYCASLSGSDYPAMSERLLFAGHEMGLRQNREDTPRPIEATGQRIERVVRLTVMDFHLVRLGRAFDVSEYQIVEGIGDTKESLKTLKSVQSDLLHRSKAKV